MLIKFGTNLNMHMEATKYFVQVHMYMYLAEITKLFKQIIIHYINKLRYADRFYH